MFYYNQAVNEEKTLSDANVGTSKDGLVYSDNILSCKGT